MSGNIDMASHKITDLPQPTADQEACTKKYADDLPAGAWAEIEDIQLDAPAASVSFAGIPAGYAMFLLLWHDVYGDNILQKDLYLRFNGDSGNNYDFSLRPFGTASDTNHALGYIQIASVGDTDGHEIHGTGQLWISNRATHEKVVTGFEYTVHKGGAHVEDVIGRHIEAKWRNVADEISTITITIAEDLSC